MKTLEQKIVEQTERFERDAAAGRWTPEGTEMRKETLRLFAQYPTMDALRAQFAADPEGVAAHRYDGVVSLIEHYEWEESSAERAAQREQEAARAAEERGKLERHSWREDHLRE